jgi:hypothetical protein
VYVCACVSHPYTSTSSGAIRGRGGAAAVLSPSVAAADFCSGPRQLTVARALAKCRERGGEEVSLQKYRQTSDISIVDCAIQCNVLVSLL